MPQKALTSKGRKSLPKLGAANRHGKIIKQKKGGNAFRLNQNALLASTISCY